MPGTKPKLTLNWERTTSYQRTQLLKVTQLMEAGDYTAAAAHVDQLKVEKALRVQMLAFIAATVLKTDRQTGLSLFERALREATACWLRTDQLRTMGYIVECLSKTGLKPWAKTQVRQIMIGLAAFGETEPPTVPAGQQLAEACADLGFHLRRSGFRREAARCFGAALSAGERFHPDDDDSEAYSRRVALFGYVAAKMAEAGLFKPALRLANRIKSKTFNGLEYHNYELQRVETLRHIASQLAGRRRKRRAKRVLQRAARIIIRDVHEMDQLRTNRLLELAAILAEYGFPRQARGMSAVAQRIAKGVV
jgi:hypothetical protein